MRQTFCSRRDMDQASLQFPRQYRIVRLITNKGENRLPETNAPSDFSRSSSSKLLSAAWGKGRDASLASLGFFLALGVFRRNKPESLSVLLGVPKIRQPRSATAERMSAERIISRNIIQGASVWPTPQGKIDGAPRSKRYTRITSSMRRMGRTRKKVRDNHKCRR